MRAIATAAAYAPTAALSSLTNGGSLISTFYYNSRLQPCHISIRTAGVSPANCVDSASLGNILDSTYNFLDASSHNNGNVASIANNLVPNRSQNFSYDSLNRLSTAQTSSTHATDAANCWAETYSYDPWGNLLKLGADIVNQSAYTGCSQESGFDFTNFTGTNNRITASGYTYDAAGNLITSPGPATVVFNAENQLVCAGGTTYLYDGDGKRVEKETGCAPSTLTPATLYWYGAGSDALLETSAAGQAFNSYVFFNGQRVAKWTTLGQGGVNWFLTDHLGTSRYVWSTAGADISDFYPFGGERVIQAANGTNNRYKFTGKERDSESGLDNFGARFDSSTLGRFMSPDHPFSDQSEGAPQSWNLYTYARNNPLRFTDPDGRACVQRADGSYKTEGTEGQSCEQVDEQDKKVNPSTIVTVSSEEAALMTLQLAGEIASDRTIYLEGAKGAVMADSGLNAIGGIWEAYQAWRVGRALAAALTYAGGVTAESLQTAAVVGGTTVRVVTTVDGPLVAGRGIYVAAGDSADAVAEAAGGSTKYVANIPSNLLKLMERAGLAEPETTMMGNAVAKTYRITSEGMKYVEKFFHAVH